MQRNTPASKSSTFSNFVYKTNHRFTGRFNNERILPVLEPVQEPGETPENPSVHDICTQTNFRSLTSVNLKKSPRKIDVFRERCTQTSKTVITLEEIESVRLSPDSLSPNNDDRTKVGEVNLAGLSLKAPDLTRYSKQKYVTSYPGGSSELSTGSALTKAYLERNKSRGRHTMPEVTTANHHMHHFPIRRKKDVFKSQSYVDPQLYQHEDINKSKSHYTTLSKTTDNFASQGQYICPPCVQASISSENPSVSQEKSKRSFSFMSPTISSERKDQRIEIECIKKLIAPTKRGRSASPKNKSSLVTETKIVPYIDKSQVTIRTDASKNTDDGNEVRLNLNTSCEVSKHNIRNILTYLLDVSITN